MPLIYVYIICLYRYVQDFRSTQKCMEGHIKYRVLMVEWGCHADMEGGRQGKNGK
jgi:hypothetical protein